MEHAQQPSPHTRRTRITGVVLAALGAAWLVIDQVLQAQFPDEWGGPNIGGGLLVLVSYLLVIAGVLLFVLGRRAQGPGADRGPSGTPPRR